MSIRHALLALLSEGPKYGLQLRHEFEARTGEVWPLNVGQVYTTLQRLERDGLVASDDDANDGPQKGYAITDDGAHELTEWLSTPPDGAQPVGAARRRATRGVRPAVWRWSCERVPRDAAGVQERRRRRDRGARAARRRPVGRARRTRRDHGPERFGQVEPAHHRRQPRG